jgi:uncharacterized protein YqgC (DUF456 family)
MLSFYELNAMTIIVILITAIITYTILDRRKKDNKVNIGVSILFGLLASIIVSYSTIESDNLMTDNYWD